MVFSSLVLAVRLAVIGFGTKPIIVVALWSVVLVAWLTVLGSTIVRILFK